MKMRFNYFLLSIFWLSAASLWASEKMYVRIDPPKSESWVGQQVIIPLTVGFSTLPKAAPTLRIPEVTGGIYTLIPGATYGTERHDGTEYTTWIYSLVFYSHQAGHHTAPPIVAEAPFRQQDGSDKTISAESESLSLDSKMPEGARSGLSLISTTQLDVSESWEPEKSEFMVGDAITRTIIRSAPNVMGLGFAPLSFIAPTGTSAYPGQAHLEDKTERGDFFGKRTESVVYIFESEGVVTVPAISIQWFDLQTEELKEIVLPERVLTIVKSPAYIDDTNARPNKHPLSVTLFIGIICVVIVTLLLVFFAQRMRRTVGAFCRVLRKVLAHLKSPLPPLNPSDSESKK